MFCDYLSMKRYPDSSEIHLDWDGVPLTWLIDLSDHSPAVFEAATSRQVTSRIRVRGVKRIFSPRL